MQLRRLTFAELLVADQRGLYTSAQVDAELTRRSALAEALKARGEAIADKRVGELAAWDLS